MFFVSGKMILPGATLDNVDTSLAPVDTFSMNGSLSMAVRPEKFATTGIVVCRTTGNGGHKRCPSCGFKIRGSGHEDGPHHKQAAAGGVKTRRQSNGRM